MPRPGKWHRGIVEIVTKGGVRMAGIGRARVMHGDDGLITDYDLDTDGLLLQPPISEVIYLAVRPLPVEPASATDE